MKTTLILAIATALVLVLVAVATFSLFGAKNTPEETSWSMGATVMNEEGETTTEMVVEGQRVYGNISEIGKDYLIIDGSLKLGTDEHTKVYENEVALDDLKEGDRVRVDYANNFEALRIYLQRSEE
jgi:hypothetical protein